MFGKERSIAGLSRSPAETMRAAARTIAASALRAGRPRGFHCLTAGLVAAVLSQTALAGRNALPLDFPLSPVTYGGAGGGVSQTEPGEPRYFPVIMVAGIMRTHHDWTGHNPGNAPATEGVSVYDHLLQAGFRPIELWMIDFAREGEQMSSIEEATDDLKFFICSVMRYTGAGKVQILAHDSGCILARLTIVKYNIAHWIDREVYIAGPFHGVSNPHPPEKALHGYPNAWCFAPGSSLLHEIMLHGESLSFLDPRDNSTRLLKTMTIRNGTPRRGAQFSRCPDSPSLIGATNISIAGLDHDGLRCSAASAAAFVPFLMNKTTPYDPTRDRDGDGFTGKESGGPDLDDDNPSVYPGATEIKGDGIDQDCNGRDLDICVGRDGEIPIREPASAR